MKLAIEIIKREIAQRELAQKHSHLCKDEVQLELDSLNKVVKKLTILDVSNSVCSCRPNTDLYCKTVTYCNKCNKEVKVVRTN